MIHPMIHEHFYEIDENRMSCVTTGLERTRNINSLVQKSCESWFSELSPAQRLQKPKSHFLCSSCTQERSSHLLKFWQFDSVEKRRNLRIAAFFGFTTHFLCTFFPKEVVSSNCNTRHKYPILRILYCWYIYIFFFLKWILIQEEVFHWVCMVW